MIDPNPIQPTIQVAFLLDLEETTRLEQDDTVRTAEGQVKHALDELVSSGVLQPADRMDIESLLNAEEESVGALDETRYEEILWAVMDTHKTAQEDGEEGEDGGIVKACPTHREVLQAAAIISRYIDGVNNPVAWKLEEILGSFGH
jgi:hypothetical protein